MRLFPLLLTLALVLASVHAATVGQNTKWYNQNANVTYVMPFDFNATSLGFNGNTFWIYNSTMNPNAYINLSFTTPSYLVMNLSDLTASTSYGKATLYDSYDKNLNLQPFTLYFNSSKDEGTLMPVWNASTITLNYSLADRDWVEVNYSLNGGTPTTLSSETAVVSQTQWDATQNVSTWNGVAFNATETYYLRKAHLYFTVAGTYNVTVLDSNLNILDSVIVTSAGGDTEIGGWSNVKFTSGNTYYLLANTSTDSNLGYMSSDVLADACWANSTDLTSVTLDCTKDTYFKLIKLTYTNTTLSPLDGYNNVTLTAKDSAGSTYSLLWEFINANKTIYSGLWHTIYASGAIERERILQNGSFDNYVNISDKINVIVSNGSANFYATVPKVNSMFFNLSGSGNNVTITVMGTPVNSVWLRYRDGLFNGSVTVRLDGIFNDTISLSSHTLNYTRVPLVENLTASPSSISQGESVTVTVDIIESVGSISTAVLENTETGTNYSMSLDSGNTYTTYIPGSDLQKVGTHTLRVYATNSFGNTNGLMTIPLTVQQSSGVLGGGGSGDGGSGAPFGIEPSKKWCQALSAYIDAKKWSEELCSVLEGTVPEVRNAEIIYFVTNFYKKGYCSATRGKAPLVDCHEEEVKAGEVIYTEGYAYSTSGIVFPQSYKWNLINLKNNLSVSSFNGRSIQFTVLEPGEYFLALVVTDTQNLSYITNYTFKVVKPVTDEEVSSWKNLLSSLRNKSEGEVLTDNESDRDGLVGAPLLPKEPVEKLIGGKLDGKRMLLISASFILSLALIYRIFFIRRE